MSARIPPGHVAVVDPPSVPLHEPRICGGIDPEWLARVIAEADAETWARWIAEPHAHAQECAEKPRCADCLACYVEDMRDAAAEALGTLLAVSCCEHGPTVTVTWRSGDRCPLCASYENERRLRTAMEEWAEGDCAYGDNCPSFGSRHGRCIPCKARTALEET